MFSETSVAETPLDATVARLRACRLCRDAPLYGAPLPQEPRPIVQGRASARLCVASQAPGNRADKSGIPFMDPSGTRLRDWLGLDEAAFYDADRLAIMPMGACFPGYDAKGGDKPPRRECAERWRVELFAGLPNLDLILVIGQYAQAWHLGRSKAGLTDTVRRWREILGAPVEGPGKGPSIPRVLPLPHPSWRNSGWLKANPWFEAELLPVLKAEVATAMAPR